MTELARYSFGIGDRFGLQGRALLQAFSMARAQGVTITPVWNKSEREHSLTGTEPAAVRRAADDAVRAAAWPAPYFVDADHVNADCVSRHLACCDFFTIDVAHALVAGLDAAAAEAARIYQRIAAHKGAGAFIVEISMDETDTPQTPEQLFTMLRLLASAGVPAHTIAPRFPGRFNKGVDYDGDPAVFAATFDAMVQTVQRAVHELPLPATLKLSLHSGSDKFAIYPAIRAVLARRGAGLHIKTAGTTWLEELCGLAAAGGEALAVAQNIYRQAFARRAQLTAPYAHVLAINPARLPAPATVDRWSATAFAAALEHNSSAPQYNADVRQLLHTAYPIAAELGVAYHSMIARHADMIGPRVTTNIFARHMRQVFPDLYQAPPPPSPTARRFPCRSALPLTK